MAGKRPSKGKADAYSFYEKMSSKHICPYCEEELSSVGRLCHHISMEHQKKKVFDDQECPFCSKRLSSSCSLVRHVTEVHKTSATNPNKCKVCLKIFRRKENLKLHFQNSHTDQPKEFKCSICYKTFSQSQVLNRHVRDIHMDVKFECKQCPATFKRRDVLREHIRSGNHYIRLDCQHCKQTLYFKSRFLRDKHFLSTSHVKAYSCRGKQNKT